MCKKKTKKKHWAIDAHGVFREVNNNWSKLDTDVDNHGNKTGEEVKQNKT